MRKAAGILMAIGAVILAALGFGTLLNQPAPFVFMRALPALLVLVVAIILARWAYRVLKGRR